MTEPTRVIIIGAISALFVGGFAVSNGTRRWDDSLGGVFFLTWVTPGVIGAVVGLKRGLADRSPSRVLRWLGIVVNAGVLLLAAASATIGCVLDLVRPR
jgi:hypothetical protein